MSNYRIFETNEFKRALRKLGPQASKQITKVLQQRAYPQLRDEPHYGRNVKKLTGYDPDTWRYRVGDYRVLFGIDEDDKVVDIFTVAPRRDAYR